MTSPELFGFLHEIFERDGHKRYDDKETIGEVLLSAGFTPGESIVSRVANRTAQSISDHVLLNCSVGCSLSVANVHAGKTAVDDLRTQSTSDMYRDFDSFNAAFIPFRSKKLADMLFKTSVLKGRYLKEIVRCALLE